jgi:hypothetical protein
MSRDLITQQFKNSRIRGKVEHLSKGASESVNHQIERIAGEQTPVTNGDTEEQLQDVYENLRRRALLLIEAGAATAQDFQGLL